MPFSYGEPTFRWALEGSSYPHLCMLGARFLGRQFSLAQGHSLGRAGPGIWPRVTRAGPFPSPCPLAAWNPELLGALPSEGPLLLDVLGPGLGIW